jgi:branched-chain amino acid transport system substrate-binding protein
MTQKNETKVLIFTLLITLGLIGGGIWIVKEKFFNSSSTSPNPAKNQLENQNNRFSSGEQILINNEVKDNPSFNNFKQQGITAIKNGNYNEAINNFKTALKLNSNAPESLIYLNNAIIGNNKSYTIAVVTPAGNDPDGALEILRGVAQVQTEINQKNGINGIPLKVLIANDDNQEKPAQEVADKLVKNIEVLGVIGHWASQVTISTVPVYNQGKLVSISPISTSVKLTGISPYILRTVPSDYIAARSLGNYMLNKLKLTKAVVYYNSQSAYSQSLKSEFSTAVSLQGGKILNEVDLASSNFDASQSVNQAIQQGAEVLMLAANTDKLDQALAVIKFNKNKLKLLAGDDVYTFKTLQIGGEESTGMVIAVPWHIEANKTSEFTRKSKQLWSGADVNWRSALASDAAKALIAGITANPTREGVQQTLTNSNFTTVGASGEIRFLPSGDRNAPIQLIKVVANKQSRSGTGYDFVPVSP